MPHQPYHLDCALIEGEDIVMTEGELDAVSLMLALKNDPVGVFAVPGLHCFSEAAAAKLSGRRVFLVTDNDQAGREGREKLAEMIYGYAREVQHIEVKSGFNDVNAMLAKEGRRYVAGWFGACVQGAVRPARRLVWDAEKAERRTLEWGVPLLSCFGSGGDVLPQKSKGASGTAGPG